MAMNHEKKFALIGRLALLVTTFIWGTSFVILKNTLDSVSTLYILAFRFSGAAVLLLLFCLKDLKKLTREYFKGGILMGVFVFAAYVFQTYGLVYTTPGVNAFLTATYCVIVPFLYWLFRGIRPDRYNISAVIVCIVGLALVVLTDGLSIGLGEGLTVCCGLFYALHIIVTAKYVEGRSPMLLTMIQFATSGILAWIAALITEPFPTNVPLGAIGGIAYLCVMCTAVCYILQTLGQKYTEPSAAAVILTLESVFATVISVIFYHEKLTARLIVGFVLIFCAVLISETKLSFLKKKKS
jgi:drug/metabolite transporter (DMT)-like permease